MQESITAVKHAKRSKQSPAIYDPSMTSAAMETHLLENDLRLAIERKEFELFYQPIVDLKTSLVTKAEALIRWRKNGKLISPVEFIPYLEESELIIPVGRWIIQQALQDLKEWQQQGAQIKQVSVNISIKQLADDTLSQWVSSLNSKLAVSPENLVLEVTESLALESSENMELFFERFGKMGVEVALDDFGTGYSSLSYLHRYPFKKLKIDRSFISNINQGDKGFNLLQSIIALSKSLELQSIAEGIEDAEVARLLSLMGVHYGQGFYYSRPIPHREFIDYLLMSQANTTTNQTSD